MLLVEMLTYKPATARGGGVRGGKTIKKNLPAFFGVKFSEFGKSEIAKRCVSSRRTYIYI
jgi:hypothetical protein